MRRVDGRLRELQKVHNNLMKAIELGQASLPLIERLNTVDDELNDLGAKQEAVASPPVELPADLPSIYRSYVDDLVGTRQDDGVASRASDELHELVESAVVTWRADAKAHDIELRGKLLKMLKRAKPASAAGFDQAESSLKLVAGAGFEPATFRL
jgi:site-specific DNA recombinase